MLLAAVSALIVPADANAEASAHVSTTCSDYSNQRQAQLRKDTRDADGDGIYCESLPCPCLGKGGGAPRDGGGGGGRGEGGGGRGRGDRGGRKKAQRISARITSVVDGDTIRVRAFGAKRDYYTVRLIGIDTPETKKPGTPVECGGKDATSNMFGLAFTAPRDTDGDGLMDESGGKGRRVTLTTDPTQDTFDRYGRLLAYVRTSSGVHLQVTQLADGWAKVYVFERRFRQHNRFRRAQSRAKRARRGVWKKCGGNFHRRSADSAAQQGRAKELPIHTQSQCRKRPAKRIDANARYTIPSEWAADKIKSRFRPGRGCGGSWLIVYRPERRSNLCLGVTIFPSAVPRRSTLSNELKPVDGPVEASGVIEQPLIDISGQPGEVLAGKWVQARWTARAPYIAGAYEDGLRGLFYETYIDAPTFKCSTRARKAALRLAKKIIQTFQVRLIDPSS